MTASLRTWHHHLAADRGTSIAAALCHHARRAINPGDERSLTVTRGHPASQVRPRIASDLGTGWLTRYVKHTSKLTVTAKYLTSVPSAARPGRQS